MRLPKLTVMGFAEVEDRSNLSHSPLIFPFSVGVTANVSDTGCRIPAVLTEPKLRPIVSTAAGETPAGSVVSHSYLITSPTVANCDWGISCVQWNCRLISQPALASILVTVIVLPVISTTKRCGFVDTPIQLLLSIYHGHTIAPVDLICLLLKIFVDDPMTTLMLLVLGAGSSRRRSCTTGGGTRRRALATVSNVYTRFTSTVPFTDCQRAVALMSIRCPDTISFSATSEITWVTFLPKPTMPACTENFATPLEADRSVTAASSCSAAARRPGFTEHVTTVPYAAEEDLPDDSTVTVSSTVSPACTVVLSAASWTLSAGSCTTTVRAVDFNFGNLLP